MKIMNLLSVWVVGLSFAACAEIGGEEENGDSALHEVAFFPEGADEGLVIGRYNAETQVMTSLPFNDELEISGVVMHTNDQSLLLGNLDVPADQDSVALQLDTDHYAQAYLGDISEDIEEHVEVETLEGVVRVSSVPLPTQNDIDIAAGCTVRYSCTNKWYGRRECFKYTCGSGGHVTSWTECFRVYTVKCR